MDYGVKSSAQTHTRSSNVILNAGETDNYSVTYSHHTLLVETPKADHRLIANIFVELFNKAWNEESVHVAWKKRVMATKQETLQSAATRGVSVYRL